MSVPPEVSCLKASRASSRAWAFSKGAGGISDCCSRKDLGEGIAPLFCAARWERTAPWREARVNSEEEMEFSRGVVSGVLEWPIALRIEDGSSGWPEIELMGWWSCCDWRC